MINVEAPEPSLQGLGRATFVQPVDETDDSLVMPLTLIVFGSAILLVTTVYGPRFDDPEELEDDELELEDDELDDDELELDDDEIHHPELVDELEDELHHCALAVDAIMPKVNRHIVVRTKSFRVDFFFIKNLPLSKCVLKLAFL